MDKFQIIMIVFFLILFLFNLYIGYVFFFGDTDKKMRVSSSVTSTTNDTVKIIFRVLKFVLITVGIYFISDSLIKLLK